MNVLYHHRTQGTGGEGVHIGQIIRCLRDLECHVDVVSPTDTDPNQLQTTTRAKPGMLSTILRVLSKALPQQLFVLMELAYNLVASRKLYRRSEGIDLIYERFAFFLFAGSRVAKQKNIPLIVEVNEIAGEERVRKQAMVGYAKKIEQEVFSSADHIICVSGFLKRKIAEMGVDPQKIHVLPNAADADTFDPNRFQQSIRPRLEIPENKVVLGFIGWFVSWHNFDLLIEALGRVKDEGVTLLLVGDGDLKEELEALAIQHGCLDDIVFTGSVPYTEIPEYINAMDICIIPGSNQYRSPIKLFEYMCMGKAVVAPRLEPIEQVTQNEQNVVLFESGDVDDFTRVVLELVKNKEERDRIGQNARSVILEKYLWKHNAQAIIEIFDSIKREEKSS